MKDLDVDAVIREIAKSLEEMGLDPFELVEDKPPFKVIRHQQRLYAKFCCPAHRAEFQHKCPGVFPDDSRDEFICLGFEN